MIGRPPTITFARRPKRELRCRTLGGSTEPEVVLNHSGRSDRHATRICQIELAKDDLVAPDLAQEILEYLNRQLLTRTPPVSKAEWSKTRIVTNRMARPVYNPENCAESTIRDVGLTPVFHLEICDVERTPREADLPALVIGDLRAGRNLKIPSRIEAIWVLPVNRIQAGAGMGRADVTVPFQRQAEFLLRRGAVGARSGVVDCRDASAVRRD
jgi:hypothetical protein